MKSTWKSINKLLHKQTNSTNIMEIKDDNNQRIKAEDIPNAFNKHFIETGQNLSQQIPISNLSPDYYIDQINENFTFREIN